jgi:hypothetical protein
MTQRRGPIRAGNTNCRGGFPAPSQFAAFPLKAVAYNAKSVN